MDDFIREPIQSRKSILDSDTVRFNHESARVTRLERSLTLHRSSPRGLADRWLPVIGLVVSRGECIQITAPVAKLTVQK